MIYAEARTNYPVKLVVDDLGEGFALTAKVHQPIEPTRLCKFVQLTLEQLAETLETTPGAPLAGLDVLPAAERQELLEYSHGPTTEIPCGRCLHHLVEAQVARTPTAVALIFGDQQLSYAALDESANRLAHHLIAQGVGAETLVGLYVERGPQMVV